LVSLNRCKRSQYLFIMSLCCKKESYRKLFYVLDMKFVEFSRNESSSSEPDDSGGDNLLSLDNEADISKGRAIIHRNEVEGADGTI